MKIIKESARSIEFGYIQNVNLEHILNIQIEETTFP